jgi:hypothetical protein
MRSALQRRAASAAHRQHDALARAGDDAVVHGAETLAVLREREQPGVVPDAIAVHGVHMVQTLSLWFRTALLPDGWANGVPPPDPRRPDRANRARRRTGCRRTDACPRRARLGNVHSHAFQRGMAGLAEHRGPEADDFWTWREAMYRFLDRLEPDDVVAIAEQAYVEMLESGFTRVGEFHYCITHRTAAPTQTRAK